MANNTPQKKSRQSRGEGYVKLPFHSPTVTKGDKKEVLEKLRTGGMLITHLDGIITPSDWFKIKYDHDNGVWLVMYTYTPTGDDAPIGIVTQRAKTLSNAVGLSVWFRDQVSDSDFITEDEDDF